MQLLVTFPDGTVFADQTLTFRMETDKKAQLRFLIFGFPVGVEGNYKVNATLYRAEREILRTETIFLRLLHQILPGTIVNEASR